MFPAVVGAFGAPTVINNVETLCNVPHIVTRGADWGWHAPSTLGCLAGHSAT